MNIRNRFAQRFNVACMERPWLDAGIFFAKILLVVTLLGLAIRALAGCGGAPFTSIDQSITVPDAGPETGDVVIAPHDAAPAEGAASDADAGTPEAGPVEASPADTGSAPEAGEACCKSPTPACSYPLGSCPIPAENHGSFPSSFEVYTTPAEFCATTSTPSECLCDYSCTCLLAHWQCPTGSPSCKSDPVQGLLLTCSN